MKALITFSFLLSFASSLLANGSPINSTEIYGTGNIEMMKKENISLAEELLLVEFEGDYATVNVEYKFTNHGLTDTITYGFPIDVFAYFFEPSENIEVKSIQNFEIKDNNEKLPFLSPKAVRSADTNPESKIRAWYIAKIIFEEQKTKTIHVSYKIKCHLDDWVYTKSFRPTFSDRTFTYTLKPSQNWGNGVVQKFVAKIDTRKILEQKGIIKEIYPDGYINKDGILIWELSNFDLKGANDIQIVYDNSAAALSNYISEMRIPIKFIKTIRASSILKTDSINRFNYEPKNLFDNDLNTAWVEGVDGNGEGEWVEVEFKEDVRAVVGIGIINGYTKRKAIYNANNRIKKLRLDIERDNRKLESVGIREASRDSFIKELKQKQFNELNREVEAPFISWLADFGEGDLSMWITKIRITILEVYPGTKYEDTCISELYLLGWFESR